MATYVIGDVQGCHKELCRLLELLPFSTKRDKLWFVGDLVNRGPESAAVLREIIALGANSVLGNHDFHLLMIAAGFQKAKKIDGLDDVLTARDRDDLLYWLRHRPLAARPMHDCLLVHAGVAPSWRADDVMRHAREVEHLLHSDNEKTVRAFLKHLYGNKPARWHDSLRGIDRTRTIVNIMARIRFCSADGKLDFSEKRGPAYAPAGMRPWFMHERRQTADVTLVCGHWSTLGLSLMPNVLMIDSGCLWGGMLTAVRLEDRAVFQTPGQKIQTEI
ncbi:MAG: symmetrical bis(5'-nucleosyl)-tetraphosphatase [Burkholderiales bacterium]|jgi:bis(5'-nucleosyl)-tetraphosphatase (symmetrical)|nr:symmetrical bis(5'-nucleosyl)-tetraphosphatase [Burkholderiales bacterium]